MALSKERMGEIAIILLREKMKADRGFRLDRKEIQQELDEISKKVGISVEELKEFFQEIFGELFRDAFSGFGGREFWGPAMRKD